jgi:1-acyl-sn-glycerol-3-phosphate acyltransferase
MGRWTRLCYQLWKFPFVLIFRLIFRTVIVGADRVPLEGPLLVVANHTSFADPPLLGVVLPRRIEFMTMVELFRNPIVAWLIKSVGCIPVDRNKVDHSAAREAIRRLRAGHCIGIFPEGGIRLGADSVLGGNPSLRPGLETIALLSQAAILPVIIRDSRKPYEWRNWFRRPALSVTFGCPFCLWQPPSGHDRTALQQLVREELLKTVALN